MKRSTYDASTTLGRKASGAVWMLALTVGRATSARMSATWQVYRTRSSVVQSGSYTRSITRPPLKGP